MGDDVAWAPVEHDVADEHAALGPVVGICPHGNRRAECEGERRGAEEGVHPTSLPRPRPVTATRGEHAPGTISVQRNCKNPEFRSSLEAQGVRQVGARPEELQKNPEFRYPPARFVLLQCGFLSVREDSFSGRVVRRKDEG